MWLNYHQLYCFWMVSREGTISRAARQVRVGQPTLSVHLRNLEAQLGVKLFLRQGRRLVHTETGAMVYRYAEEILSLGNEMLGVIRQGDTARPPRLVVGITDTISKLVACALLAPALALRPPVQLACYEDNLARLLPVLATHRLDVLLADAPVPAGAPVRTFSTLLADSALTFLAAPELARRYRRGFPQSLDGAPMLLPTPNTILRRALGGWMARLKVRPHLIGEVEDAAMLKSLASAGGAVYPCPSIIEAQVRKQYQVRLVGHTQAVRERFYAISVERRVRHPAVLAICTAAEA